MASNRSALRGYLRQLRVPLRHDIVDIYLALYRDGSDDPDGPPRAAIWVLFAYGLMTVWMTANQSVHAVFWESMARPGAGILEPTALYHVGSIAVANCARLVGWILLYVNPEEPRRPAFNGQSGTHGEFKVGLPYGEHLRKAGVCSGSTTDFFICDSLVMESLKLLGID